MTLRSSFIFSRRKVRLLIEQRAHAVWRGGLKQGSGSFRAGALAGKYSFSSRFEGGAGRSPEELIGAAQASCFSMAPSLLLGEHGYTPEVIETRSTVYLDAQQLAISRIEGLCSTTLPVGSKGEKVCKDVCKVGRGNGANISRDARADNELSL